MPRPWGCSERPLGRGLRLKVRIVLLVQDSPELGVHLVSRTSAALDTARIFASYYRTVFRDSVFPFWAESSASRLSNVCGICVCDNI